MRPVDVAVVGGRAAGAATALLLARAGLSVVLVDRERPGADTLSTHALMRAGVLQLHRWGILPQVVDAGTPAVRETAFHYAHSTIVLPIKESASVDALFAPRRTVLDPILLESATSAGAEVQHSTRVVSVRRHRGRVDGVVVARAGGGARTIPARLVIGADGRHSTIARLVAAPVTRLMRHTSAFTYGYFRELPACGYEWAYRPAGTAGFIPTNDDLTCVFAGHTPSRVGRGGLTVLHDLVGAASPALGERLRAGTLQSPVRTFTGEPGRLRRPWGPGWALVGDAGSWKDPISAHGLTDALRDAELLARAVVADLGGEPGAFETYERVRDHLTEPILTASAEIAAMRWDEERIMELLRTLTLAMAAEIVVLQDLDRSPGTGVSPEPLRSTGTCAST